MNRLHWLLLLIGIALVTPGRLLAQQNETPSLPLETFVLQVARLWADGDAEALVQLAAADGRIMMDVGGGAAGPASGRHATAALRAMFDERETLTVRPVRATIAGGTPVRGFGEIEWVSHPRGVTTPQTTTLYVGTVWESDGWRIHELRLLR